VIGFEVEEVVGFEEEVEGRVVDGEEERVDVME